MVGPSGSLSGSGPGRPYAPGATLRPAMSEWYSIEVFDGASSAALWAEAYGDPLLESALSTGAQGLVMAPPQLGRGAGAGVRRYQVLGGVAGLHARPGRAGRCPRPDKRPDRLPRPGWVEWYFPASSPTAAAGAVAPPPSLFRGNGRETSWPGCHLGRGPFSLPSQVLVLGAGHAGCFTADLVLAAPIPAHYSRPTAARRRNLFARRTLSATAR